MKTINDEYKILATNKADGREEDYRTLFASPKMWMLELDDQEQFFKEPYVRPLEFRLPEFQEMEEKYGEIKELKHDFILSEVYGFLLADKHKEFFMLHVEQEDVVLHKAVLVGEREENKKDAIFEGYWLLATPHRPLNWVDPDKSRVMLAVGEKRREREIVIGFKNEDIEHIRKFSAIKLNESLNNIDLKERQIFNIWENRKTYFMNPVVHNTLVEYMQANDSTEQLAFHTFDKVLKTRALL